MGVEIRGEGAWTLRRPIFYLWSPPTHHTTDIKITTQHNDDECDKVVTYHFPPKVPACLLFFFNREGGLLCPFTIFSNQKDRMDGDKKENQPTNR